MCLTARILTLPHIKAVLCVQVVLGGPLLVEPRLLAAVRGMVATYQSEVENLTLEVLGSWDRPLNKRNEVSAAWYSTGMTIGAGYCNHGMAWLREAADLFSTLTLGVMGSWDRPLGKRNEVGIARHSMAQPAAPVQVFHLRGIAANGTAGADNAATSTILLHLLWWWGGDATCGHVCSQQEWQCPAWVTACVMPLDTTVFCAPNACG
jgi:hypothetical protein